MNIQSCVHNRPICRNLSGLEFKIYNGYCYDDVNYDATAVLRNIPNTGNAINMQSLSQSILNSVPSGTYNYTVVFNGFFLAPVSGVYTFTTSSDDCSFIWIGPTAIKGAYTLANSLVNNSGLHGNVTKSATITLIRGQSYPFRLLYGQATGSADLSVGFILPNTTAIIRNGLNYYYRYA